MTPADPGRRSWLHVLTGTRPGLERLLLASFPALFAGTVAYFLLGRWIGLGVGVATLVILIRLTRPLGE